MILRVGDRQGVAEGERERDRGCERERERDSEGEGERFLKPLLKNVYYSEKKTLCIGVWNKLCNFQ